MAFDLPTNSRWVKVAYIKIVQLTAGDMEVTFEIWENSTYNVMLRTDFHLRKIRRRITVTAAQGAEYGETIELPIPVKDRDAVDEERTYNLHCRLVNELGGTASDFAVSLNLADMGEKV